MPPAPGGIPAGDRRGRGRRHQRRQRLDRRRPPAGYRGQLQRHREHRGDGNDDGDERDDKKYFNFGFEVVIGGFSPHEPCRIRVKHLENGYPMPPKSNWVRFNPLCWLAWEFYEINFATAKFSTTSEALMGACKEIVSCYPKD